MKLTKHQQKLFELGKKAKAICGEMSYRSAIGELYYHDFDVDAIVEDEERQFFEAGYYGFEPQWRQAYRYGEIPEGGYSTNWATGEREKGVSCVCLIGGKKENEKTIYDFIYGEAQGTKKIKIEGWFMGDAGADGEPLLIRARKIEEV